LKLNPTNTERTQASHTITTKIPNTTPREVNYLIDTLLKLDPTDTERTQACHTILATLPHAHSWDLDRLVGLLRQLCPVHDWLAALGIENT